MQISIKELTAEIAHYIVANQHSALCNLYKMPMDKELRYVDSVQESFNAHHDAIETMLTDALQGAEMVESPVFERGKR